MKAVSYARVSSREQEETGYSLESQIKSAEEYASRKEIEIRKVFRVSESASGKQTRKTFLEMLQYAARNGIDIILCEKIDRLTRNLKDAAVVDDWVHEKEAREIHFIKEHFILNKNTKAHDNFVWDMKVAVARFYTNNLSEEVKKGQKEKVSQGWLPTKPPLGYKTIGEKGHKIHVIDDQKGPFVQTMFELYGTGNYSTRALVIEMSKRGLRSRTGSKVGKSRIHALLSDPFYCGKVRWKGVVHKGSHVPLVTVALFERVHFLLNRKIASPQYRKHLPVFKAKIQCEECGGTITWEIQKARWYGHCNHYKNCSQKKWVRQDNVEEQLFPLFDKVAPKNERVLAWIERALKESHAEESQSHAKKQDDITRSIERTDKRMERAYLDKLDGTADATLCQKIMTEAKAEKDALVDALKALGDAQAAYYEAGYAIHELAAQARAIYNSDKAQPEDRRLLLSHVFSNLTLNEGEITPNYTYAFEFLANWVPKLNASFELEESQSKQGQKSPLQPEMRALLPG
ncbi:MAG: hypothetical protein A2756_00085 [Candidatus Ryanbacteria bacterium RIFCSPHIGHO2_01_FULL_48_27]|uniref:Resolvase n=1 Tax=Candidatus Ryanbacteria bacterium RIFCSPHIGHO2_01_FULL_48_27 TaxID=1802115 RepID=A0A1G2G1M4_9BACT|nr:MAG: hypothetical protein A2756_00085 [Candidatus Ryanbacteria bacterium RIFCSPHIGHO2_01_FULL_48_27]